MTRAIGIDIGGTGIKGAVVDASSGELVGERHQLATPEGASPHDVLDAVERMFGTLGAPEDAPVGVCFPAIVREGRTLSAANVSHEWIGLEAEELFERRLGVDIHFINDADAAGIAEVHFGAARGVRGLVLMTTLGTGIGTALLYNGVLIPNAELGHLEIDGVDIETVASTVAREREGLTWEQWAARLQRYYERLEFLLSPELFVVGGGVSASHELLLPHLELATPIVPAALRNDAGLMGAAHLALNDHRQRRAR